MPKQCGKHYSRQGIEDVVDRQAREIIRLSDENKALRFKIAMIKAMGLKLANFAWNIGASDSDYKYGQDLSDEWDKLTGGDES